MTLGIPSLFLIAVLLHFVVGVKIFSGGTEKA